MAKYRLLVYAERARWGGGFFGRLDLTTDRSSVWTLWDRRLVLVLAVLVAPWVALVARNSAAVFAGARRSGLSDVGGLTAIALAGFHRPRCHYQEVHAADHGYPVTRLATVGSPSVRTEHGRPRQGYNRTGECSKEARHPDLGVGGLAAHRVEPEQMTSGSGERQ